MFLFVAHVLAAPEDAPVSSSPCRTEDEVSAILATQRASGVTPDVLEDACPTTGDRLEMEVRVRPRIEASDFPKGLTEEARCNVHLLVDTRGKVEAAVPHASCPEAARASARKIGLRYQFYPKKVDGKAVATDYDVLLLLSSPR